MSNSKNLVKIWELYQQKVLTESAPGKKSAKMTTKKGPGPVDLNSPKVKDVQNKDTTGAENAEGYSKDIVDKRNKEHSNNNVLNINNLSFSENFDKNMEKTSKAQINNNMKSIFDKLFEDVMSGEDAEDLKALGVNTEAPEGEDTGMEDMGGESEEMTHEEIIEMLEKALAALKKHAETTAGEHDMEDMGDETDEAEMSYEDSEETDEEDAEEDCDDEEDSEEEDDDDGMKKEATGAIYSVDNPVDGNGKLVPDSAGLSLTKHSNIIQGGKTNKLKSKGQGKAQFNVNNPVDGDGKEVPDSAGLAMTKMNAIEPKSKIKGKNQEFFGV